MRLNLTTRGAWDIWRSLPVFGRRRSTRSCTPSEWGRADVPETNPPPYLRQTVINRSGGCCEYCRSQLEYSPDPFVIEHVIPRASGGQDDLENPTFSCGGCNGHKYTKTEASDPLTSQSVPLFHPRRQRWRDHFEWSADLTLIIGITPTGPATVGALNMNRPGVVNPRRVLSTTGVHPPMADVGPEI